MLPEALKQIPFLVELDGLVLDGRLDRGETEIRIAPENVLEVCRRLKAGGFNRLAAVTAVDWHPSEPRFELVYLLHSLGANRRLKVKCRLPGDAAEIDSVTSLWRAANWYEREVFDLFGITFRNHPDLRRIMLPEDWQGHPLRKDYPKTGYKYTYQEGSLS